MSKQKLNRLEGRGELVLIKGLLISLGVILTLSVVVSYMMTVKDMGENILAVCSVIILGIGSLIGSYFSSRKIGTGGLKIGGIIGGIIFLIAISCGAVVSGLSFHGVTLVKAVVCGIFGMIGGVMGVNQTAKRKL